MDPTDQLLDFLHHHSISVFARDALIHCRVYRLHPSCPTIYHFVPNPSTTDCPWCHMRCPGLNRHIQTCRALHAKSADLAEPV